MHLDEYRRKLTTPEAAAARLLDNDRLIIALSMAEPRGLLEAIAARLAAGDLRKLRVFSLLPLKHALETVLRPDLADCVEATSAFVSAGERGLVASGLNYFVPNHFHQVPRLLTEIIGVDVTVTTVSPMDRHGYFSFGTANDYTSIAARSGRLLMVEVNPNMPRVFGGSLLHVSEVDLIVEHDVPLNLFAPPEPAPEDAVIGKAIAELVPDGACLQLGFGALPNSVAGFLEGHRDLGIHTEVFAPAMVGLIEKGVVTGARKSLHPRKHVFTVAQGDQAMLDFMHDNPATRAIRSPTSTGPRSSPKTRTWSPSTRCSRLICWASATPSSWPAVSSPAPAVSWISCAGPSTAPAASPSWPSTPPPSTARSLASCPNWSTGP